jgi:hypothetical protein
MFSNVKNTPTKRIDTNLIKINIKFIVKDKLCPFKYRYNEQKDDKKY